MLLWCSGQYLTVDSERFQRSLNRRLMRTARHVAAGVEFVGKVMGVIKARAAGRVDMSTVSARVRTMLTPE